MVAKADEAFAALHDVTREPQAQAGADAAFGGEERLEESPARLRLHAFPMIGHGDPYARRVARRMGCRPHLEI